MKIEESAILDIALEKGFVSQEDFDDARRHEKTENISGLEYLLENNILSSDLVGQAMAEHYNVPYADLNTKGVVVERVLKIPEKVARKYSVVVFDEDDTTVTLATSDPDNSEMAKSLLWFFDPKKIRFAYATDADIEKTFLFYKKDLSKRFSAITKLENRVAPEMVTEILESAIGMNASDVHFEPRGKKVMVRFRVDGVLREMGEMDLVYYQNIVNHLKVSASLRIDEHKSAQDGALHLVTQTKETNIRVSIIPVVGGEKIVLRILSRNIGDLGLENLGLSARDWKTFEQAIQKPFGMIVVSGPTGSGKTTTLYALLKKLNSSEINITSIEDPVEYILHGANQIQVSAETGMTFARGLRSVVRQDPDVIFVGEIRDLETAEISVNAALTGHLLFSTFHANNAESTFVRFVDMGIEKFLLASTLELVVSQRLLRRICEKCRYSHPITPEYVEKFFPDYARYFEGVKEVYEGKGCSVCRDRGYNGRIAAFQVIQVTSEIQRLILKEATSSEIWEMAKKQGSMSLFEDAFEKAKLGVTSFEEVFRVTPPQI